MCGFLLHALQLGLQIDQVLLQLRAPARLVRELAAGSRKGSRSQTGFFPHAAQLRVHVLQLRYDVFRLRLCAMQVRAQAIHLCTAATSSSLCSCRITLIPP